MFVEFTILLSTFFVQVLAEAPTLSIFPSADVRVNSNVNLTCTFKDAVIGALFNIPDKNFLLPWTNCTLQTCSDNKTFTKESKTVETWNNKNITCEFLQGGPKSNGVVFNISVPVNTVNLTPDQTAVNISKQIELTCATDHCNPAAKITWYKESLPVEANIIESLDSDPNGLIRTKSVFTYTGVKEDNMKKVYCAATNALNTVNSSIHFLNVWFPPSSKPAIFPSSDLMFNDGSVVYLSCQLSGGNPLATLIFQCVGKTLKELNQTNSTTAVSVLQFEIDSSFNNRTCTCTGKHPALENDIQHSITLAVNVPVTAVNLTLDKTAVNVNQQIDLTCTTNYCNPAAKITWYKESSQVVDNVIETFNFNKNGLIKTTSVFTYKGAKEDNRKQVYCTARNFLNTVNSSKYSLDVKYPPASYPTILANPASFEYDSGTRVNLTCRMEGGNPLATLSFECNKVVATHAYNEDKTAVSELSVIVDKSYNNKQCSCLARHQLLNSTLSDRKTLSVFYNNIITSTFDTINEINESQSFHLECNVDGNPLSNITWIFARNNSELKSDFKKNASFYEIRYAKCLDYGEYIVHAENGKGPFASATTKLAVNCKPRLYTADSQTSEKLGVGNNESLQIFTRILLYPNSEYIQWNFTRKLNESKIISNNSRGYTIKILRGESEENITLYKENVDTEDFGNYTVIVRNSVGTFKRKYQVSSARSPLPPFNLTLICDNPFSITLTWIADFNGGDSQTFHILSSSGENISFFKELETVHDKGYGKTHSYSPAVELYGQLWFRIAASNKFGNSTTDDVHCFTKTPDESSSDIAMIAGIAVGGGLCLAFAVIIFVVYFRKYYVYEKSAKHIQRLNNINENETDDADVDGLKENSLYVSAGPKDDEKSEAVVYAAVAKKLPQNDNNSNLYADVKKSGRQDKNKRKMSSDVKPKKGLLNKEEKAKQKKGKKQKNRPGETDVYENSEDIALSTNVDNVYSNAGRKGLNKKEERGYKNKDGLLYVEVNFDGKQGQDNPIIHGEDEKTDYATVEFPMPSSVHKASGGEEL